jgi:hypothetical protein
MLAWAGSKPSELCALPFANRPGGARQLVTFFCFAKESHQSSRSGDSLTLRSEVTRIPKGDPQSGSFRCATGNLRCSITAASAELASLKQLRPGVPPPSALLGPARTGFGYGNSGAGERCPRSIFGVCLGRKFPTPFWLRRGAQVQTDQGSHLSEPKASLCETPAGPSTAGCP